MDFRFRNTLRKIAAVDADAKTKPIAMVGTYPDYHKTKDDHLDHEQLLAGRGNQYFDALYDSRLGRHNVRNDLLPNDAFFNYFKFLGNPISTKDLAHIRQRQAERNAASLFEYYTPQFESAYRHLLQRGKENEARFKSGDLYNGGPRPKSKIQLPANIKDPAKRKMLEQYGNIQANTNIPGGGRGQGFGIG